MFLYWMAPPNPESAAALFIHFSFSQVHGRGGEEEAEEEAEEEEEEELLLRQRGERSAKEGPVPEIMPWKLTQIRKNWLNPYA